jgi:hypothetical protein
LNRDPRIQIVQYNEDIYILRLNVCVHREAPFTYLLFGNTGALLIDTGTTSESTYYPLRAMVDAIVTRWSQTRRKKMFPLTVVLTSAEDVAQNRGLAQFSGRPATTVAPEPLAAMTQFYKLTNSWPSGAARIDPGLFPHLAHTRMASPLRFLQQVPLHRRSSLPCQTQDQQRQGLCRIAAALEEVEGGKAYFRFTTYKPYERVLQMEPDLIDDALDPPNKCWERRWRWCDRTSFC